MLFDAGIFDQSDGFNKQKMKKEVDERVALEKNPKYFEISV